MKNPKLFFLFIFFLVICHSFSQSTMNVDSLISKNITLSIRDKIDAYLNISFSIRDQNIDRAFALAEKSLKLADSINYTHGKGMALSRLGFYYSLARDFTSALSYYQSALELFFMSSDTYGIALTEHYLGDYYRILNVFDKSMEYYISALKRREAIKDSLGIAHTKNSMGIVYKNIGNYENALLFSFQALKILDKLKDKESYAYTLNNIGLVYIRKKDFAEALKHMFNSLKIRREINSTRGIGSSLNNIGIIYYRIGDYSKSLKHFRESLKYKLIPSNDLNISETYNNIGRSYIKLNVLDSAYSYLKKAQKIAIVINASDKLIDNYEYFIDYFTIKKDYKNSNLYFSKYVALKDSLFNKEINAKINNLQLDYEIADVENENTLLKETNLLKELEIQKQTNIRNIFIFITLIFLIISGLIYLQYRSKKKANELLNEKNNEILTHQTKLSQTLKELKEANDTKDKFFSIISHDLKSPLSGLVKFSEILKKDYHIMSDVDKHEFITEISATLTNLYKLTDNLLFWSIIQRKKITFYPLEIDIQDLINDCLETFRISIIEKKISVQTELANNNKIFADSKMISIVLRNLISNAVKFSYPEGKIKITTEISDKMIFSIEDEGVGISLEDSINLFSLESNYKSMGTSLEEGTGLGLILCKEFITINQGEIWYNKPDSQGTKFSFSVPLAIGNVI